ncbi:MAG: APC family permease [Balneolaceae bacterium]
MENELKRTVKTSGAVLMGMGSIIGTGLFVSLAIATQIAGNGILIAIVIGAVVAVFNGLSSAQLAAAYPVSGGTYEYGYRVLGSYWGFTAGWMFLIAKSASAATAVLGCAGYLLYLLEFNTPDWVNVAAGLGILTVVTSLVSGGIRRSNTANALIVSVTIFGLVALVAGGIFSKGLPVQTITDSLTDFSVDSVLYASALMFVAYTGYGRIATLGEEVVNPAQTIPRAIILSMTFIVLLYLAVAMTAVYAMGAEGFGQTINGEAAPLMIAAAVIGIPGLATVVSVAAITAMVGVLLNLILGLSRVMLGMARRRDIPTVLSRVNPKNQSPVISVWITGLLIGLLVLSGDVRFTWSFSAFTVLIYYAITNLSALRLPPENRLYPRWIPAAGLTGCLTLIFWIEPQIWIFGVILIAIGIIWHVIGLRNRENSS